MTDFAEFASDVLIPDRYERKPGIRGRTHGDRKDTIPAINAMIKVTSAIFVLPHF